MEGDATPMLERNLCSDIHIKLEKDPGPPIRKPLSPIDNIQNQLSPAIFRSKYGSQCPLESIEDNETSLFRKDNSDKLSSFKMSDTTKVSHYGHSHLLPPLFLCDSSSSSSKASYNSDRTTPSPAQRSPNTMTFVDTPSRSNSQDTPKSSSSRRYNPFESCADVLQFSAVSPSLFREVVSPSAKEDKDFSWAIDQLALLHPTNIEGSPREESEVPLDPEYEKKAQEAIDRFFSSTLVVPSPWGSSGSRSISLVSALFSGSSKSFPVASGSTPSMVEPRVPVEKCTPSIVEEDSAPKPKTTTVWCQTELTLPPVLPMEVEAMLAPFCTFTQDQCWQQEDEGDDTAALNTTSLRRKLLFSDEEASTPQSVLPEPPVSRVSSSEPAPASQSECGSSSPASTGPLPLDEEDSHLPWGVSMIRPSSRVSLPCSPTSPKFLHSSMGGSKRRVSGSSTFSSPELAPSGTPVSTVSPITYVAPHGFRTLPSPSSDCFQTPSRRGFLPSPKLSPICKFSPHTPKSPRHPSGSPQSYPSWKGHSSSGGESNEVVSLRYFESPMRNEETTMECQSKAEVTPGGEGFVLFIKEKLITETTSASKAQVTPQIKERAYRGSMKASPHFSSSPIKKVGLSDGSSSPLDQEDSEEKASPNSPLKFADSPAVSPISWKCEDSSSAHFEFWSKGSESAPPSYIWPQSGSQGTQRSDFGERMEDVVEGGKDVCQESSSDMTCEGFSMQKVSGRISEPMVGQTRGFFASSSVTLMDTDSRHMSEGSFARETSGGYDTGYQTGCSLLTTNQSNTFQPCSSLSHIREPKSPLPLPSPRKKSRMLVCSHDLTCCLHCNGGIDAKDSDDPLTH